MIFTAWSEHGISLKIPYARFLTPFRKGKFVSLINLVTVIYFMLFWFLLVFPILPLPLFYSILFYSNSHRVTFLCLSKPHFMAFFIVMYQSRYFVCKDSLSGLIIMVVSSAYINIFEFIQCNCNPLMFSFDLTLSANISMAMMNRYGDRTS